MLTSALSIAPVFALIVLGYGLRRGRIPSYEFWQVNDKLVYWVLMPSLLFYKTSTAEYEPALIKSYAFVIVGAFLCALAFGAITAFLSRMPAPTATSLLQGSARHNTFLALAIAEKLYGSDGLALAALASAMLVPVTNLTIVPSMALLIADPRQGNVFHAVLRDLVRNPLILAVGLGVVMNYTWGGEIPIIHDMTKILGGAALPIMLLCVGASLRIESFSDSYLAIVLSTIGKMVLFPLVTLVIARYLELSELETMVALVFAAAPTASSAYTLARQLGGDAQQMAAIITIQTALSFLTLPLTLILAGSFL